MVPELNHLLPIESAVIEGLGGPESRQSPETESPKHTGKASQVTTIKAIKLKLKNFVGDSVGDASEGFCKVDSQNKLNSRASRVEVPPWEKVRRGQAGWYNWVQHQLDKLSL